MEIRFPSSKRLERALGITVTLPPAEAEERQQKFAQQALDELVDWTLGQSRANTIAELDLRRVNRIFRYIRDEEVPTTQMLVGDFSLPAGRAQSMVGRMKYGDSAWVEGKAIASALNWVRAPKVVASDWETNDGWQRKRTFPKSLDKLLTAQLVRLYEIDPTKVPLPSKGPTTDGFGIEWTMPVTAWEELEGILESLALEYAR